MNDAITIEFYNAVRHNDLETVNRLINSQQVTKNLLDHALKTTAMYGYTSIMNKLIKTGANIHINDEEPLHLAALRGHLNIVNILIDHGANIHSMNDKALMIAAREGNIGTAFRLIECGADIYANDNYVSRYSKFEIIRTYRVYVIDKFIRRHIIKVMQL